MKGWFCPKNNRVDTRPDAFLAFATDLMSSFSPLDLLTLNQSADIGICDRKQRLGWLLKYW